MTGASSQSEPAHTDLRQLVGHRHELPASATVDFALHELSRLDVDFIAVLDGVRLAGVCARRDLSLALGSRFGFALNANRPVSGHLVVALLRAVAGSNVMDLFQATAARRMREFFDDVLLVDATGKYLGLIPMSNLVRLQTEFLLGNLGA